MHPFDFVGASAQMLLDGQEMDLDMHEKLADRAAFEVALELGGEAHARIGGGSRYLQSGLRKDLDVVLIYEGPASIADARESMKKHYTRLVNQLEGGRLQFFPRSLYGELSIQGDKGEARHVLIDLHVVGGWQRLEDRLRAPIRPFHPETDIQEPVNPQVLKELADMMNAVRGFYGKASVAKLLSELIQQGRVYYAEHLPGLFRAQRMPNGEFRILIHRSLRWLVDGERAYVRNLSPPRRRARLVFVLSRLFHETAETLMESSPNVAWDRGHLDPQLPNTEAVAYGTELQFLATVPGFLASFTPLVHGQPLLLRLYGTVLGHSPTTHAVRRQLEEHPGILMGFLNALGFDVTTYSTDQIQKLQTHVIKAQAHSLAQLESNMTGHYHHRLVVFDDVTKHMVTLRYVQPEDLTAEERAQATKSLQQWVPASMKADALVGELFEQLREPSVLIDGPVVRLVLGEQGEVEGLAVWNADLTMNRVLTQSHRYRGLHQEMAAARLQELLHATVWPEAQISRDDAQAFLERQRAEVRHQIQLYGLQSSGRNADGNPDAAAERARFQETLRRLSQDASPELKAARRQMEVDIERAAMMIRQELRAISKQALLRSVLPRFPVPGLLALAYTAYHVFDVPEVYERHIDRFAFEVAHQRLPKETVTQVFQKLSEGMESDPNMRARLLPMFAYLYAAYTHLTYALTHPDLVEMSTHIWRTGSFDTAVRVLAREHRFAEEARVLEVFQNLKTDVLPSRTWFPSAPTPAKTTTLEIGGGMGEGDVIYSMPPQEGRVVVLDINQLIIHSLQETLRLKPRSDMSLVAGDGSFLPFKTESIHQVQTIRVLQYLTPLAIEQFFLEVARVLVPGGHLRVIAIPDTHEQVDQMIQAQRRSGLRTIDMALERSHTTDPMTQQPKMLFTWWLHAKKPTGTWLRLTQAFRWLGAMGAGLLKAIPPIFWIGGLGVLGLSGFTGGNIPAWMVLGIAGGVLATAMAFGYVFSDLLYLVSTVFNRSSSVSSRVSIRPIAFVLSWIAFVLSWTSSFISRISFVAPWIAGSMRLVISTRDSIDFSIRMILGWISANPSAMTVMFLSWASSMALTSFQFTGSDTLLGILVGLLGVAWASSGRRGLFALGSHHTDSKSVATSVRFGQFLVKPHFWRTLGMASLIVLSVLAAVLVTRELREIFPAIGSAGYVVAAIPFWLRRAALRTWWQRARNTWTVLGLGLLHDYRQDRHRLISEGTVPFVRPKQLLDDYHGVATDFQWQPNMLLAGAQAYFPHEYEALAHHLQQGHTPSRNWLSGKYRSILPESIGAWNREYRQVRRAAGEHAPVFLGPLLLFLQLSYRIKRLKELTPSWVVHMLRWMRQRWVVLVVMGLGVAGILLGWSGWLLAGLAIPRLRSSLKLLRGGLLPEFIPAPAISRLGSTINSLHQVETSL